MKTGWTEAYDTAMNDLMEAKEEIIKLNSELMKWKATAEELNDALALMSRDRDYWQFIAQKGGGNEV